MRIIFVVCSFLVFTACSNYSIFTKLDSPNTERISLYTGKKLVLTLEENINSPKFYKTLTEEQKNKIISSLDEYIQQEKKSTTVDSLAMATRSAMVAIDILINTDSLIYEMIYNMANPAFVYLVEPSASLSTVFCSFTSVFNKSIQKDKSIIKPIALCFYNLYKITEYYDLAANSSKYGGYSGGDLQKFIVSAIVSGILSGTAQAAGISGTELKNLSSEIAQIYVQVQQNVEQDELILQEMINELEKRLGVSGKEIAFAYKNQLNLKANILEEIALFAGFYNLAEESVKMLKKWGSDEKTLSN